MYMHNGVTNMTLRDLMLITLGGGGGHSAVLGSTCFTENGTYDASDYGWDGFDFVEVDVPSDFADGEEMRW